MVFGLYSTINSNCYRMKHYFLIIFLFSALHLTAQIDSENKSIAIPAAEVDDPDADNAVDIIPEKKKSEVKPNDAENDIVAPKEINTSTLPKKAFSMIEDNNFANPAELFQGQLSKQLSLRKRKENNNNGSTSNQFLGEVRTTAVKVNVIYRDHQYPDGDLIRVFVNGDIVRPSVLLTAGFSGFNIDLEVGINKIDFQALNQGSSGPNTAEFQILDENGNTVAGNQWNLATGVKATIILTKPAPTEEETSEKQ